MSRTSRDATNLLLGEWACLGILYNEPSHGFAVAQHLKPGGDIGRVWSLSRPLTYRALEQLQAHGYIEAKGEAPGIAGGNKTVLAATRSGRAAFRAWLNSPVVHLRDLRSELLLKLVLAQNCGVDVRTMISEQKKIVRSMTTAHGVDDDVVGIWRREAAEAALRFLNQLR